MLMPYDDFLFNAKKNKYDVEILMHQYACSFGLELMNSVVS
jgi:predicted transcriptional regulator